MLCWHKSDPQDSSLQCCYTTSSGKYYIVPDVLKCLHFLTVWYFKMSVTVDQSTWYNNLEDLNLQQHYCENLKSYKSGPILPSTDPYSWWSSCHLIYLLVIFMDWYLSVLFNSSCVMLSILNEKLLSDRQCFL